MEETDYRFYRYSTIFRESRDFGCVVTSRAGRPAPAPPFFRGPVYFGLVQRTLYGEDGLADSDRLVCNHPYEGTFHTFPTWQSPLPPFTANDSSPSRRASPTRRAWAESGTRAAHGAKRWNCFRRTPFLLPPLKIVHADANRDLERLIAANSHVPELAPGDMRAQRGRIGPRHVEALCRRADAFAATMKAVIDALARSFKAEIARPPEGEHALEAFSTATASTAPAAALPACSFSILRGNVRCPRPIAIHSRRELASVCAPPEATVTAVRPAVRQPLAPAILRKAT